MVKILVRSVEPGDAEELAPRLRQADLDEIEAAGYPDPFKALRESAACSTHAWTVEVDDEVAVMFGVVPVSMVGGVGCPWMLGSDAVVRNAGAFIKRSLVYIPIMLEAYPHLFNVVDVRNTKAIRWLKRAGFTLLDPISHGPYNMQFHPFEMKV